MTGWPFSSSPFCQSEFPQLWNSFLHAFIDASHAGGPAAPRPPQQVEQLPTVLPAVTRLVAIGDLHGDLQKTRRAFRIAGLIDEKDRWVGGTTTVVQVGDILDRGDQELELFFWLERLQHSAAAAGGAVHVLNGNHETMSVAGNFRYATLGAALGFGRWRELLRLESALKGKCGCSSSAQLLSASLSNGAAAASAAAPAASPPRDSLPASLRDARLAALAPGGQMATRFLARHPTVLQVGSTVFVHGGLLPQHVEYGLERINKETQAWILGGSGSDGGGTPPLKPKFLTGRSAVVWSRHYSAEDAARCDCASLAQALQGVPGARRMVVGHTIQEQGINSACQGQVYRIDVGMSKGCGANAPEVLEILNDSEVRRITDVPATSSPSASKESMPPGTAAHTQGAKQAHAAAAGGVAAAAATPVPAG